MSTAYTNLGGTGPRRPGTVIVTASATSITGDPNTVVDGSFATDTNHSMFWSGTAVGAYIKFQFFRAAVVDKIKLYMSSSTSQGTFNVDGSNDGSSWTTFTSFTWNTATQEVTFTNTNSYLYYRIIGTSGTLSSSPWIEEVEFSIDGSGLERGGDRTSLITVTKDAAISGTASTLVDGTENSGGVFAVSMGVTGKDITWDFGATSVVMVGFVWLTDSSNPSWGTWKIQGWNGAAWVDVATGIVLGGNTANPSGVPYAEVHTWANSTGYVKYRMLGTSGTTDGSGNNTFETQFMLPGTPVHVMQPVAPAVMVGW